MQNCVQLDDDGENQCQTERRESSTKLSESRDPGFKRYANLLASERLICSNEFVAVGSACCLCVNLLVTLVWFRVRCKESRSMTSEGESQ